MASACVRRKNLLCYALIDLTNPFTVWECAIGRMRSACDVPHNIAVSSFLFKKIRAASEGSANWLKRELALEDIRSQEFPDKVSRLSGIFLFTDQALARPAARAWGMSDATTELSEVNFSAERGNWHDSCWIADIGSPVSDWGRKYWEGQPKGANPQWELIASGIGMVVTKSVRERCYLRASSRDPHATLFLAAAASAFAVGHLDTGMCMPYLSFRRDTIYGEYIMFEEDFRKLDWSTIKDECDRMGYVFPDRREINQTLRTPDFTEMNFKVKYPL